MIERAAPVIKRLFAGARGRAVQGFASERPGDASLHTQTLRRDAEPLLHGAPLAGPERDIPAGSLAPIDGLRRPAATAPSASPCAAQVRRAPRAAIRRSRHASGRSPPVTGFLQAFGVNTAAKKVAPQRRPGAPSRHRTHDEPSGVCQTSVWSRPEPDRAPAPRRAREDRAHRTEARMETDPRPIRLGPEDTVLVVGVSLAAGPRLTVEGEGVELAVPLTLGHKIAARPIEAGERVLKCGMPIGVATRRIERRRATRRRAAGSTFPTWCRTGRCASAFPTSTTTPRSPS
jgi:hypothetical protein